VIRRSFAVSPYLSYIHLIFMRHRHEKLACCLRFLMQDETKAIKIIIGVSRDDVGSTYI
jgi:hypothetical protein